MWKLQRKFLQYEDKEIEAQFFGCLARNLAAIPTKLYGLPVMLVQVANRKTKEYRNAPNEGLAAPAQDHSISNMKIQLTNKLSHDAITKGNIIFVYM
jgi:hypothetical protein